MSSNAWVSHASRVIGKVRTDTRRHHYYMKLKVVLVGAVHDGRERTGKEGRCASGYWINMRQGRVTLRSAQSVGDGSTSRIIDSRQLAL